MDKKYGFCSHERNYDQQHVLQPQVQSFDCIAFPSDLHSVKTIKAIALSQNIGSSVERRFNGMDVIIDVMIDVIASPV